MSGDQSRDHDTVITDSKGGINGNGGNQQLGDPNIADEKSKDLAESLKSYPEACDADISTMVRANVKAYINMRMPSYGDEFLRKFTLVNLRKMGEYYQGKYNNLIDKLTDDTLPRTEEQDWQKIFAAKQGGNGNKQRFVGSDRSNLQRIIGATGHYAATGDKRAYYDSLFDHMDDDGFAGQVAQSLMTDQVIYDDKNDGPPPLKKPRQENQSQPKPKPRRHV